MTVVLDSLAGTASLSLSLAAAGGVSIRIRIPSPTAPLTSRPSHLFPTKQIHLRAGNTGGVAGVNR
jgi:hypothetical protein